MIEGSSKTCLARYQPDNGTYFWLGEVYVHEFERQIQKCVSLERVITIVVR